MERNIKTSIESLGSDVVFVQKWPWSFGSDYPWWKYMNRPNAKFKELEYIDRRLNNIATPAYTINLIPGTFKYYNNSVTNANVQAVSHNWSQLRVVDFDKGRYFTEDESNSGRAVALIGSAIADGLFGGIEPIGKYIKVKGIKLKVIGVFKREGESLLASTSLDNQMIIPINYARNIVNIDDERLNPTLMVKPKIGIAFEQVESELKSVMRAARKLKPSQDDNFALNKITLISKGLDTFFGILTKAGWLIGGLSILVGGFGIANIMFVSVKERTNQIGIQKSLGAKRYFILTQFLFESIILTFIGGALGMLIVWLLTILLSGTVGFNLFLSSKLDPVEAIRTGI
jgi:putative ABC transport system permease protein